MNSVKDALDDLLRRFDRDATRVTKSTSTYSETELRVEFIDPLFRLLGWDMDNSLGLTNSVKDVVREESQPSETANKRPDYTFRVQSSRKFFLEAKRASIDTTTHRSSIFQARSYGFSAGHQVVLLCNFRSLSVYDARIEPRETDDPDVGLILTIGYRDLGARFDDLRARFGKDEVVRGSLDEYFGPVSTGSIPVNVSFLARINNWRVAIATDLHQRYPALSIDEIGDFAQKVINRIIFIRMCEDRGIEGEETLRSVARKRDFVELRALFRALDAKFNTGLFDVSQDRLQDRYSIDADLLLEIVDEVYAPDSPYNFSVLDADFLGQVYELYLVKRLQLKGGGQIDLVDKPAYEDREIVTTPQPLVNEVVRRALDRKLAGAKDATLEDLGGLRILDVAIGSGRFLMRALDGLVDAAIDAQRKVPGMPQLRRVAENDYRLSFEAKRTLVKNCLFGIDVDYSAVEAAKFSLMVKILEDEAADSLPLGKKLLPNLDGNIIWGNTVVDTDFPVKSGPIFEQTCPLNWNAAGIPDAFDLVVGNPPYVNTEGMKSKTPEEFEYFKASYDCPFKQFDKYFVFIERAIAAMKPGATMGMVVPNKWITIEAGSKLRALLAEHGLVHDIVDFGNEQIFDGKSAYVCLLVLTKSPEKTFWYRHVNEYSEFVFSPETQGFQLSSAMLKAFGRNAWVLPASEDEAGVLDKLFRNSVKLCDIASVKNGIQTSANDVFLISQYRKTKGCIHFEGDGRMWGVEEAITRPYVNDSAEVVSYHAVHGDALMIFPYEVGPSGAPIAISPARMKSAFPLAWSYLEHFKARLIRRDVSPPPSAGVFYAYGRHQALETVFHAPKIVYSVNQRGEKYGLDTQGVAYASGGTAGECAVASPLRGYTLEFILGLLNQKAIEFFVRKRGSPFGNGYFARGTAVLSDVPVPNLDATGNPAHAAAIDAITQYVRQMLVVEAKLQASSARSRPRLLTDRANLRGQIKKEFDTLWGFSGEVDRLILPGDTIPY